MIDSIIDYFKKSPEERKDSPPQGYCPNCWGRQKYDDVIRELYKDKQIDVNNDKANYTFVRKFVVTRIDGIQLIRGDLGRSTALAKHGRAPQRFRGWLVWR